MLLLFRFSFTLNTLIINILEFGQLSVSLFLCGMIYINLYRTVLTSAD